MYIRRKAYINGRTVYIVETMKTLKITSKDFLVVQCSLLGGTRRGNIKAKPVRVLNENLVGHDVPLGWSEYERFRVGMRGSPWAAAVICLLVSKLSHILCDGVGGSRGQRAPHASRFPSNKPPFKITAHAF